MPHFYLFIYLEKQWCRIPKRLKKERVEDEDLHEFAFHALEYLLSPGIYAVDFNVWWRFLANSEMLKSENEWLMAFLSNRVGLFVYYFILFFFCSITHDEDRNKNSFCASVLLYIPKVEYMHRFTPIGIEVDWNNMCIFIYYNILKNKISIQKLFVSISFLNQTGSFSKKKKKKNKQAVIVVCLLVVLF